MSPTPLETLATQREHGGRKKYGHYLPGKRSHTQNCREAREELADAYNYVVVYGRVERPYNEAERRPFIKALEAAWGALEALEAAQEIESPGHPEAGEPASGVTLPDPAGSGPPAWGGG